MPIVGVVGTKIENIKMSISWELFQDSIKGLIEDLPTWVYVLALSIFVGGSALVLTVKGRKKEER